MYHSITFGDKNTWDDWHLIPNGRPIFTPPKQKTNYIDIPGANGSLDMSEALTGYPLYENREGSFSFIIMNPNAASYPECDPKKLDTIYMEIASYLHGKTMSAVLEDDPGYKYEGRFHIEGITAGSDWSTIDIGYNVDPYKRSITGALLSWEWDPFNFLTDRIIDLNTVNVSTTPTKIDLGRAILGDEALCPDFIVSSTNGQGVYIRLVNPSLGIDDTLLFQNGKSKNYDFIFYNEVELYMYTSSGTGTVTMEFYPGRL